MVYSVAIDMGLERDAEISKDAILHTVHMPYYATYAFHMSRLDEY
jgi:hypothetical protein